MSRYVMALFSSCCRQEKMNTDYDHIADSNSVAACGACYQCGTDNQKGDSCWDESSSSSISPLVHENRHRTLPPVVAQPLPLTASAPAAREQAQTVNASPRVANLCDPPSALPISPFPPCVACMGHSDRVCTLDVHAIQENKICARIRAHTDDGVYGLHPCSWLPQAVQSALQAMTARSKHNAIIAVRRHTCVTLVYSAILPHSHTTLIDALETGFRLISLFGMRSHSQQLYTEKSTSFVQLRCGEEGPLLKQKQAAMLGLRLIYPCRRVHTRRCEWHLTWTECFVPFNLLHIPKHSLT